MNIRQALIKGTEILKNSKSGINVPMLDAELILAHILNKDRVYVICHFDKELDEREQKDYFENICLRAQGRPLSYITSKKEFMGLEFFVDQNVLIPRDDTEILVRCVLKLAQSINGAEILNIGTGSACIEVAIAYYNKTAKITGIEKYKNAVKNAEKNIKKLGLEGRITLIESDMFAALKKDKRFDIICSNPPYITKKEMDTLSIDIIGYEPESALYGGEDGLDFYKIIANQSKYYIKPNGFVIVEIGYSQKQAVTDIFFQNGFINIECFKDLSGYDRVIKAQYK